MPLTVSILAVGVVSLPVAPGVMRHVRSVTYSIEGSMPRTVYIDLDKDTPEERKRAIAEDWKKAQTEKPQTLEIP